MDLTLICQRKRLFIGEVEFDRASDRWIPWAAQHGFEALIISPTEELFTLERMGDHVSGRRKKILALAEQHHLEIEEGGFCLSRFVPRRLFMKNRDLFRMHEGHRRPDYNFCPTNPDTIDLLATNARKFFQTRIERQVFHLWPDLGPEEGWCSCPTCRAFTPLEQTIMATNVLADVLASISDTAYLSYLLPDTTESTIKGRPNIFPLPYASRKPMLEQHGWVIAAPKLLSPSLPGPS
ncbi:MAG: hypothetical protein SNJ56_02080 [Termitinemataceae bacterium]